MGILPGTELSSSSLIDDSVLEDTKMILGLRGGTAIFIDVTDPFCPLVNEFQDVMCNDSPSVLPPDRGVCHEIDVSFGTKYCVHGSVPFQKNLATSLKASFVLSTRQDCFGRVRIPILGPHFWLRSRLVIGALFTFLKG